MLSRFGEFSPDVRRALRVDVSATLLCTVFGALTGPFTALVLRRELGASPLQLAVLASAGAACLLLSLAWARALRGRAPLPYVVWPTFLARGVFLFVPFATSAWSFVALLVAGTLFGSVSGPAAASVIERTYPRPHRGRALATVRMAGAAAGIVLAVTAGLLMGLVDYRWLFPVAAVFGMAASLVFRRMPVPAPLALEAPPGQGLAEAWGAVRADRRFRRLLLASFLFGSGIWLQIPANAILVADVAQLTAGQVGLMSAAAAGAGLCANAVWGRLVDRGSSLAALRLVYACGVLGALVSFTARTPEVLVAGAMLDAAMTAGLDLVWMLAVIEVAGARRTAQYVAIGATLAGIRGVVGPLLSGLVIEHAGVHAVYLLAAVLMSVATGLLTRQLRAQALERVAAGALEAPRGGRRARRRRRRSRRRALGPARPEALLLPVERDRHGILVGKSNKGVDHR